MLDTLSLDQCLCLSNHQWLTEDTDSWFVRATGENGNVDKATTYYYCNRSLYFKLSGNRKRHLKSQSLCKVNSYCTASIIARITPEKGIQIQYYPTHYGHATSLGHLRLSEKERVTIAGNILQGVTFEGILDDIRSNVDTSIRRIHLTTRKDNYKYSTSIYMDYVISNIIQMMPLV